MLRHFFDKLTSKGDLDSDILDKLNFMDGLASISIPRLDSLEAKSTMYSGSETSWIAIR